MRLLRWIADYWYIPLLFGGIFALWVLTRGKNTQLMPIAQTLKEIDAIRVKRDFKNLGIRIEIQTAKDLVDTHYQETIKSLKSVKKSKIKELQNDPEVLAAILEEMSR